MKNKNLKTANGQLISKMWFSFVELIIVISIIALISVIWVSINSNYTEKTKNSKISSDIVTIKSSLEAYNNENKKLPDPKWNQKFFDDSSNYVHYDDATAFWVYGNITEDTIPKKYMNFTPIDPRTNQYYAYGKTLTWTPMFQLSWVNKINWIYESKVIWNYTWETGPYNLIREYNWPDFVFDQSTNSFPYNPEEKVLKWKIWSFLWEVRVNGNPIDKTRIKNNDLISWDVIEVKEWAEAQIHYSDWSKSYLWDPGKPSKLTLANMVYKDENNLFTKIQLALDFWSIWTKTSKLDPNSEFEIYTTDTEAAVRWTIFGVSKQSTTTDVIVIEWKVNISKITGVTSTNLVDKINSDNITYATSPTPFDLVPISGTPRKYDWTNQTPVSVWSLPNLADEDWLTNITPKIKSIDAWVVVLEFPSSFSGTSNWKHVYKNLAPLTNTDYEFNSNQLTLSWTIAESNYSIKVCDATEIKCTKEVNINKTVTYGDVPAVPVWCDINTQVEFTWPEYSWCIDIDQDLKTAWYRLVAYAPYDTDLQYNLYAQTWAYENTVNKTLTSPLSHFDDSTSEKWIFISTWTSDNLKYVLNTTTWWWTFPNNYAIEISVRWSALNRTNAKYYLWYSDSDIMGLYINHNPTYPWKIIFYDWTIHPSTSISSLNLLNDQYYPVIFKVNSWIYKVTINNTEILSWSTSLQLKWNTYIWSYNTFWQWNDIINYIKFYTF